MTYLEVEVVFAVLVEFRRSAVDSNLDFAGVSSLLDSLGQELERVFGTFDVGRKSSLVTDVSSWARELSVCAAVNSQGCSPSLPYFLVMIFLRVW